MWSTYYDLFTTELENHSFTSIEVLHAKSLTLGFVAAGTLIKKLCLRNRQVLQVGALEISARILSVVWRA